MDGMETARLIRKKDEESLLIFVTNMAQYAIKGYEVSALDFVLKPLNYNAFLFRMKKTKHNTSGLGRNAQTGHEKNHIH